MADNSLPDLHRLVWTALMAALIGAGAYLIVPIGPVPVSMQPFFLFLAAYLLGPKHGLLAVALYLLAGTIGLPVFAGGKSGLGHLMGPTGGYLLGYLPTVWVCALGRTDKPSIPWVRGILAGLAAVVMVYATGMLWLKFALSISWLKAFTVGVLPFIPWDLVKMVAALGCGRYMARLRLLPGQR